MMVIPPETLSREALLGLLEAFITREGTDYGDAERTLQEKVEALAPQVLSGEVLILFDQTTESINLVHRRDLPAS